MSKTFTAVIQKEDNMYVSLCPELDIASQGETIQDARNSLREALELFLEGSRPTRRSAMSCAGSYNRLRSARVYTRCSPRTFHTLRLLCKK